jgi:protein TonB
MIMQTDFLNSEKWLALVFEGRNKEYGAYAQREDSSNRHLKAMLIITIVALGLIFLPKVITSVLPAQEPVKITDSVTPIDLTPEQPVVRPVEVPPPTIKVIDAIKFTTPVITTDDKVVNDDLAPSQDVLINSNAAISIATVTTGNLDGVDPADLRDRNAIVGTSTSENTIPYHVEVMPTFPGGTAALMKWLQENMIYPAVAQELNIQGRVNLRFVVTADGSIDDVVVIKGLDPSCDKEAMRVVKKMPKWLPGKQNGNAVPVYFSLPVTFKLQNN